MRTGIKCFRNQRFRLKAPGYDHRPLFEWSGSGQRGHGPAHTKPKPAALSWGESKNNARLSSLWPRIFILGGAGQALCGEDAGNCGDDPAWAPVTSGSEDQALRNKQQANNPQIPPRWAQTLKRNSIYNVVLRTREDNGKREKNEDADNDNTTSTISVTDWNVSFRSFSLQRLLQTCLHRITSPQPECHNRVKNHFIYTDTTTPPQKKHFQDKSGLFR